jgi:DNA-binding LacI/PurR family transcriptional regulator
MARGNRPKKRVTSYDVAREAGVSQSAVSRAFRPGLSVSKKTRDKVAKAAKKLNYQPNAIARMLITQRSGMVAVIISSMVNLIYPELLTRLTEELSAKGVRVLLFTLEDPDGLEELLEQVRTYQVDGVIALTAHFTHASISQLEEHNIPVVLYNRQVPNHPANTVCCDHEQGIQRLVKDLVKAGHHRFLVLSGPDFSEVGIERRDIALRHLDALGFKDTPVLYGDFSYQSGRDCFAQWMSGNDAPDAVICSNDMMAIGCIDEARSKYGLSVPEQVSVVGFDGFNAAGLDSYNLTTIRQPVNQMAKAAVSILLERIENSDAPPEKRVLAGEFISGNSARI